MRANLVRESSYRIAPSTSRFRRGRPFQGGMGAEEERPWLFRYQRQHVWKPFARQNIKTHLFLTAKQSAE